VAVTTLLFLLFGCQAVDDVNLFSIEDDIELGGDLRDEILSQPRNYPMLDRDENPDAYAHLERVRDAVLDSGEVAHAPDFDWEVYIVHDDETLNAFAAPGGYIFVYTGLIHFLDTEDEFVGVMGHEIAHADQRHSTEQLTQAYGVSTLVGYLLGEDPGLIAELAEGLVSLSFSRDDESESDEFSVRYLCETDYASNGAAGFFEKLEGVEIPEFLSTHPSSDTRVDDINALADELGCSTDPNANAQWADFQASLPPVVVDEQ